MAGQAASGFPPSFPRQSFLKTSAQAGAIFSSNPLACRTFVPTSFIDFAVRSASFRWNGDILVDDPETIPAFHRHSLELLALFGLFPRSPLTTDGHATVLQRLSASTPPNLSFFSDWHTTAQLFDSLPRFGIFIVNSIFALPQLVVHHAGLPGQSVVILVASPSLATLLLPSDFAAPPLSVPRPNLQSEPASPILLYTYEFVRGCWITSFEGESAESVARALLKGHGEMDSLLRQNESSRVWVTGYIGSPSRLSRYCRLGGFAGGLTPAVYFIRETASMFLHVPKSPTSPEFLDVAAHANHFLRNCCSSVVFIGDEGDATDVTDCPAAEILAGIPTDGVQVFGDADCVVICCQIASGHHQTFDVTSMAAFANWLSSESSVSCLDFDASEIFALVRRDLVGVQRRLKDAERMPIYNVDPHEDGSIEVDVSSTNRTILLFWRVSSVNGRLCSEPVAQVTFLSENFAIVGSLISGESIYGLLFSKVTGHIELYKLPFGYYSAGLPPALLRVHVSMQAPRCWTAFHAGTSVLLIALASTGGTGTLTKITVDENDGARVVGTVDLFGSFAPLVPIIGDDVPELRYGGLIINQDGKDGAMVFSVRKSSGASPTYFVVLFDPKELVPVRTMTFAWPADIHQTFIQRDIQQMSPIYFKGNELDLGSLANTVRGHRFAHLCCNIGTGRIVPVKPDFDSYEIQKEVTGKCPSGGCVLDIGGQRRIFSVWPHDVLGISTPENMRKFTRNLPFRMEEIPKLFEFSLKKFGLSQIWEVNTKTSQQDSWQFLVDVLDSRFLPKGVGFAPKCDIDRSDKLANVLPLVLNLCSIPVPAVLLSLCDTGTSDHGGVFDRHEVDFAANFALESTIDCPCLSISVVSSDGAELLSQLTGIAFMNWPVNSLSVGSTRIPVNGLSNVIGSLYTVSDITFETVAFIAACLSSDVVVVHHSNFAQLWRLALIYSEAISLQLGLSFVHDVEVVVIGSQSVEFALPGKLREVCHLSFVDCVDANLLKIPESQKTWETLLLLRKSAALFAAQVSRNFVDSQLLFELATRLKSESLLRLAIEEGNVDAKNWISPDRMFEEACETQSIELWLKLGDDRSMSELLRCLDRLEANQLRCLVLFWLSKSPLDSLKCYRALVRLEGHDFALYRLVLISCQKCVEQVTDEVIDKAVVENNPELIESHLPATSAFFALGFSFYQDDPDRVYELLRDGILSCGSLTAQSDLAQQQLYAMLLGRELTDINAKCYEFAILTTQPADNAFAKGAEAATIVMEMVDDADHPEYDILTGDLFIECGDFERAEEFYEKALSKRPDDGKAKRALRFARSSETLMRESIWVIHSPAIKILKNWAKEPEALRNQARRSLQSAEGEDRVARFLLGVIAAQESEFGTALEKWQSIHCAPIEIKGFGEFEYLWFHFTRAAVAYIDRDRFTNIGRAALMLLNTKCACRDPQLTVVLLKQFYLNPSFDAIKTCPDGLPFLIRKLAKTDRQLALGIVASYVHENPSPQEGIMASLKESLADRTPETDDVFTRPERYLRFRPRAAT
jgi:tetratricopeptide (TPR) repeat protein